MPQTLYPTGADVLALLESGLLTVSAAIQLLLATAAEAGRQVIEERCDRTPFLAGTASERRFDPPTRSMTLELRPDLATLVNVVYQPTGSTPATLTADVDFTLLPWNAVADGRPYTHLDFSVWRGWGTYWPSERGSLRVTGRWGYGTTLPDDVWLAMCAAGALWLTPQLAQGLSGGLVAVSEGDASERYAENRLTVLTAGWGLQIETVVRYYRRLSM